MLTKSLIFTEGKDCDISFDQKIIAKKFLSIFYYLSCEQLQVNKFDSY